MTNAQDFDLHMQRAWEYPTYTSPDGTFCDNDISALNEAEKLGLKYLKKAWHDGVRGELWECEDGTKVWICADGMGVTADLSKLIFAA